MRVSVYYSSDDLRLEERPRPNIGPGELLMRVEASGICGTDVLDWYRADRAPLILGHEVAGEVVEVGKGVTRFGVDDRVVAAHHVPCDSCRYCQRGHHTVCETLRSTNFDPGGFAEYVRLPAINVDHGVFPIPDNVTFEEASFVEPVACVLRGQRLAGLASGQSVLVLGSGISGLLHIVLARDGGAGLVAATDVVPYRLEAAERAGADLVLKANEDVRARFAEANEGYLAELVVICTSAPSAIAQALDSVAPGGTVLFFAPTAPGLRLDKPVNDIFWRNELTLTSSYGGSPDDYEAAMKLLGEGRATVSELVTHRLGLAETGVGFDLVKQAERSLKVIVEPQR